MNMDHDNHNHGYEHTAEKPKSKFKDFVPLILIFIAIGFFTFLIVDRSGQKDLMNIMRNFMAGFFLVFGAFKLIRWKGFVEAYVTYDIVAKRSVAYAYLYPLIELGLGIAYLQSLNLFVTNIVTIAVMIIGAIGVAGEILKKQPVHCACLGTVFKIPMTKVTLFEDLLMAGMAAWMLFLL